MNLLSTQLVFTAAMGAAATLAPAADARPNVVFINADDVGCGDVGCYGATKVRTPNIDRLAREGRMFTDAHSASAVCTPSRYALLTGEYPDRKNLYKPIFLRDGLVIDPTKATIGSLMKNAGYSTACIGKWHLGFGKHKPDWNGELKPGPLELGFEYYFGVPVVNSHPPFVYVENHHVVGWVPEDPFVFNKHAKTRKFDEKMWIHVIGGADAAHALYDDEMVGTTLAGKAVEWIKRQTRSTSSGQRKKPFFLYFAPTNIHHPFTPHPRFKGTSEAGPYGDFIHELDWIVGEIIKTLEEEGVADNTLLIFTSDNGGMLNHGGQAAWKAGHALNGQYLGFKFDAWEGGHRIPFIACWPGHIEADSKSDQLICNIDMMATLAALTGATIRFGQGRDSVNMLPALIGNPKEQLRDHLILSPFYRSHLSVRKGKWMYISNTGGGGFTTPKVGSHTFGGPAAITFSGRENSDIENGVLKEGIPPAQLYDLAKDPCQTKNVYGEYPEVVKAMKILLKTAPDQMADAALRKSLAEEAIPGIQGAALGVELYGSNIDGPYLKHLEINGEAIAPVPQSDGNKYELKFINVPEGKLGSIAPTNHIRFAGGRGDAYKMRNITLYVQLKDGAWVRSETDRNTYSSAPQRLWGDSEGTSMNPIEIELEF